MLKIFSDFSSPFSSARISLPKSCGERGREREGGGRKRKRERDVRINRQNTQYAHHYPPMTYSNDLLDEGLVGANFGLLQGWNGWSNPRDEGKLPSPTHLVASLEADVRICSLIICKEEPEERVNMDERLPKKLNHPICKDICLYYRPILILLWSKIPQYIMSSHTLVSYLQKDPATRRILCLILQLLSFCPGHHLHR